MSIWGKLIGGAAGFALGGPLGALLGVFGGHVFDTKREAAPEREQRGAHPEKSVAFTIAVIALGAKLAKADGVVTPDEVRAFRRAFHVPPDEIKNVGRFFNIARQHAHGFEPYARQIAGMFRHNPAVLEELLGALFLIAKADGRVSEDEIRYLETVATIFGFDEATFLRVKAGCIGPDAADPYQILGVAHDVDEATLKATYHRLVRENHPDKLVAQGMPEDFIAVANAKLAAINAAYDRIEKARADARPH